MGLVGLVSQFVLVGHVVWWAWWSGGCSGSGVGLVGMLGLVGLVDLVLPVAPQLHLHHAVLAHQVLRARSSYK